MNDAMHMIADVSVQFSPLLIDSALKGAALLMLASAAALFLRRDSAATRHLVWLLAILAMLGAPLLSAMLPQWRALPQWAAIPQVALAPPANTPAIDWPAPGAFEAPTNAIPGELESPIASPDQPVADSPVIAPPAAQPAAEPTMVPAAPASVPWNWPGLLLTIWAIGFGLLMLRLLAARWMLRIAERRATCVGSSGRPTPADADPLLAALQSASEELGMHRPVALLIHPGSVIPVVWGIFHCRLALPADARRWSDEQLRSVLLHELAHIKRRDTLAQLLTQIACALHWFNPLAWLAAWRLGVERERACDDLVLAGGVRPSAYAGHLLQVVTGLSPARWTQACGLAMARKSSLEGRLVAVLSGDRNRRGVSAALAAVAFILAACIAVPISMLRAADEKPAAPAQQDSPKPQEATKGAALKLESEQKLQWGQTVGGLRMALAWPPSYTEPGMGSDEVFHLVVQNVSQAPIRLTAADAAPNPRRLIFRDNQGILLSLRDPITMPGDWLLQPRQVAYVRLFQSTEKMKDGRTMSSVMEEDVRVFPQYSMTAEMTIEKAPAGAWTGKLDTSPSRGSLDVKAPNDKAAQALLKTWFAVARDDGKIPGAVIGQLGRSVETFIKYNPTWETTPKLQAMLPRFDATRDWTGPQAVALLDELAAIQDSPISMALDDEMQQTMRTGAPLPPDLATAPWGQALPSGLRMAWLLEPRAAEHRIGTPLKARILIHNSGKEPIVFRTRTWHQVGHKAVDAKGTEVKTESTSWTTRGLLLPYRLAPGEFIELNGPGIGVGPVGDREDWQQTRVGTWVHAKAGDEVTLTTGPVPLHDWNEDEKLKLDGEPRWWLDYITARASRHQPLPPDAKARQRLLYRIAMELFGTPVGEDISLPFVADRGPAAVDALALKLFHRPGQLAWAGPLISAPTKFRVLPADPDAAKKPRTAFNPGHYTINPKVSLQVTRRPIGERIVNEAYLSLSAPEKRHDLTLPDGYGTWAAAWVRGESVMWIAQKGLLRKIDLSNLEKVEEARFEADKIDGAPIPADIRKALIDALTVPEAPTQKPLKIDPPADAPPAAPAAVPATPKQDPKKDPKKEPGGDASRQLPPADGPPVHPKLADERYVKSGVPIADWKESQPAWGESKKGLSAGIRIIGDARLGGQVKMELWVRNTGKKDATFSQNPRADVGLSIFVKDKDGQNRYADITSFSAYPIFHHLLLPADSMVKVKEVTVKLDAMKGDKPQFGWVNLKVAPGDYKLYAKWSDSHSLVTHAGDWTGELTSDGAELKIAP